MVFEVGMAVSQSDAPEEVAKQLFDGVSGSLGGKPDFIMLFTTFHYNKNAGEIIRLLKAPFGEDCQITGGTVTAFICKKGCFTKGAVIFAGRDKNAEFRSGFAEGIRGNPVKATHEALAPILQHRCEKKNKVLFTITPAPLNPTLLSNPLTQSIIKMIPNRLVEKLHDFLFIISEKLGYGDAWEEEVLKEIERLSPEHKIAGISTFDDTSDTNHCQFLGNRITKNGIAIMELCFDNDYEIIRESPNVVHSGKKFKVNRGWRNMCFTQANNMPAVKYYINELMHWPPEWKLPTVGGVFDKTFYFPLGYEEDGVKYAFPVGLFFGESCNTNQIIKSDYLELYYTSHQRFFETLEENIEELGHREKVFTLFVEVGTLPSALGFKMYEVKNTIDEKIGGDPYLSLFVAGEHSKTKTEKAVFNNYGRVTFSVFQD